MEIWECKIGTMGDVDVPYDADFPMRRAIERAYREITGQDPQFLFSGWGGRLTDTEKLAVQQWEEAKYRHPG